MYGTFKFIHCADLHLGSSFIGLSNRHRDLGKRLRESMFEALENVVAIAKEEDIDFVIFAGDIFDDTEETFLTRSRFIEAIRRIGKNCYICYGNHDDSRKWEKGLPLPENAFVFSTTVTNYTFVKDGTSVAKIIGASFSRIPTEDLLVNVVGEKDMFNIGVFHCSLDSYSQNDEYAPCKKNSLLNKGVDYWALGHVHKRSIVSKRPYIVYPGNTQGKKITEQGHKGCYVVTVTGGSVSDIKFRKTGNFVFKDVALDITGKNDLEDVVRHTCSDLNEKTVLRVDVGGRGNLDGLRTDDVNEVIEQIEKYTGCFVVSLRFSSLPDIDLNSREKTGDFISEVIRCGRERLNEFSRDLLLNTICSTRLSQSIKKEFEAFSDEELRRMIADAQYRIVEELLRAEGDDRVDKKDFH
ncbi:MAG: DNA repair exonuclease [archaeon]|nr:DNA repair exonuclease [archaeon]